VKPTHSLHTTTDKLSRHWHAYTLPCHMGGGRLAATMRWTPYGGQLCSCLVCTHALGVKVGCCSWSPLDTYYGAGVHGSAQASKSKTLKTAWSTSQSQNLKCPVVPTGGHPTTSQPEGGTRTRIQRRSSARGQVTAVTLPCWYHESESAKACALFIDASSPPPPPSPVAAHRDHELPGWSLRLPLAVPAAG
jgi:hypothetical protein